MTLRLSRHALRCAALLALLLPAAVFLLTWVRPLIAIPGVAGLAAAYALYVRGSDRQAADVFGRQEDAFSCSALTLAAVAACALLWTFFSGIGGLFYQNEDHYYRNAVFHDLLNNGWPVYFEGTPLALTYYLAYWLLPALFGKAAAALLGGGVLWSAANAALFAQTVVFLMLILLLFLSLVNPPSAPRACLWLLVFVLFSGMDAIPSALAGNWHDQIEWWAGTYQYSSHTTCLFWVYNQSTPAWLALLLMLSAPLDLGSFALIGLAALPFCPLPFVGMMVYFVGIALCEGWRLTRSLGLKAGLSALLRRCLTARNVIACIVLAPIFGLYFASNASSSDAPLRLDLFLHAYSLPRSLLRLLIFALIEFAAFSLVIARRFRRNPVFWLTQLLLLAVPLFRMGYGMDFSMRASIPGITALCVFCARFLEDACAARRHRLAALVLAGLLLIGSVTPLMEFERGVYKLKTYGPDALEADPFGTVLHPDAYTYNFTCPDTGDSLFYRYIARKGPTQP